MLMKIPFIAFILLLLFSACKREQDFKIDASAITEFDENGDRTGSVDPTDWRFDDQWNNKELSLFNFGDSITTWGMQKATSFSAGAAPNPVSTVMMLSFSANHPTLLKWVITDENLNVLLTRVARLERYSNVDPNMGFGIDVMRNSKFEQGRYYRVYYALYSQGGELYKKGHGDFKKL
jgi:hypothetical protein